MAEPYRYTPGGGFNQEVEAIRKGLASGSGLGSYGVASGGLGNYGTYQGVGIDQPAYESIAGSGVTDGLNKNLSGYAADTGNWFGQQSLGDLTGLAGTGLQLYSQLFGPGKDISKAKLGLLRQQTSANEQAMADRKRFNEGFAKASNQIGSRGLAASTVNRGA